MPVGPGGAFSLAVPRDTMFTLSTTTGQAKGTAATCTGETGPGVALPFRLKIPAMPARLVCKSL
jgi:hypothetical protein